MRDLIVVITIIILVFVPGYYIQKHLEDSGATIVKMLEKIRETVEKDEMAEIGLVYSLRDKWQKEQDFWNIFSNHQNTDEIQREIEKLITNYEDGEKREALINITEIKSIVEDAPRGEGILIVNIF